MISDNLPNTLAGLLEIAINDIKEVEVDDNYIVDMEHWHCPSRGGCRVCLAGAVLAKTCGLPINGCGAVAASIDRKMLAIDYLRTGRVSLACRQLYEDEKEVIDFTVTDYGSKKFYSDLDKVLEYLKTNNL